MTETQQQNQWGFESLIDRFYAFIEGLTDGQRRNYLIGWSFVSVALIVGASLPLGADLRWVSALVGSPAGVIVFLILAAIVNSTNLRNFKLFSFRQDNPPKRRVSIVAFVLVIVAVTLIASSSFLPVGIGGTLVIVAALTSYNVIRRTQEEILLAQQGLPDPREMDEVK